MMGIQGVGFGWCVYGDIIFSLENISRYFQAQLESVLDIL